MNKFIVATAFTVISAPVVAADLPSTKSPPAPPPIFVAASDWTGFYIGGEVGGTWGRSNNATTNTATNTVIGTGSSSSSKFGGGGQIGYNYMFASRVVLGAVVDLGAGGGGNSTSSNTAGTVVTTFASPANLRGSVRAKLGYGFDKVLLYATGGWAWSTGSETATEVLGVVGLAGPGTSATANWTRSGGTLGAGLEYAITKNWSVFGEYRHNWFGAVNYNYGPIFQRSVSSTTNQDLGVGGVNYKF